MMFGEKDISREARVRVKGNQFQGPVSGSFGIQVTAAGADALERAEGLLAGIPNGIEKALNSAMSRASAHLRTVQHKGCPGAVRHFGGQYPGGGACNHSLHLSERGAGLRQLCRGPHPPLPL